jgi:hypothetical protein
VVLSRQARSVALVLLLIGGAGCGGQLNTLSRCALAEMRKPLAAPLQPPLVGMPQGYVDALYSVGAALGRPILTCSGIK